MRRKPKKAYLLFLSLYLHDSAFTQGFSNLAQDRFSP